MVSRILGPDGRPIDTGALREPQTAQMQQLHHEFASHPSRGLTPSRLASILDAAELGDLVRQCELWEDMEEKDTHLASEMGKRRRALLQLDWDVLPPPSPSAKEKRAVQDLKALLAELPEFEDVLFDVTDAIGKGYTCLEFDGWHRVERIWLPRSVMHRPQAWFTVWRNEGCEQIRLRDGTVEGVELQPAGWITHTHKAKSGWLARSALYRQLVWPYLFKNYSVADLAEFLEIYGIPVRVGKYPPGASEKEKATLLRALASIGHKAAGIIPDGMLIDFIDAATGDPDAFKLMIEWCERSQSKAILGGTLTSQTSDSGGGAYALGEVHNEVRKDLLKGDARQVAATISRDLVFPIAQLNGLCDGLRRCPRFHLSVQETEDIQTYSEALPKLVAMGMRVPRQWAQERLGIPEPEAGDEDVLQAPAPSDAEPASAPAPAPRGQLAAATAQRPAAESRAYSDALAQALMPLAEPELDAWVAEVRAALADAPSFDQLLARLADLQQQLPIERLGLLLADAFAAADRAGRADVEDEAGRA